MRAAWYERQGPAGEVLEVGELPDPEPGVGEVRIRVRASGVNPGDTKKRAGWLGSAMPYPLVVPHSDGAGEIDAVGPGGDESRLGERVWCYGAQSYRPFGTAAEYVVVPQDQAVRLADDASFEVGACLGIPGITAHAAVFGDGRVTGRTVLVAGAGGAVGSLATALARSGGATVLGTVRNPGDAERARQAGAHHVFENLNGSTARAIRERAPRGVDRIVEVALSANAELDAELLVQGGTIAVYSSADPDPTLPFWPLLFANATIRLLGSDDLPRGAKRRAARDLSACLERGGLAIDVGATFPLERIAAAHDAVDDPAQRGRVVVTLD